MGNWRRDLVYPLLAHLPASLAYPAAARLGIWSRAERKGALEAVCNGLARAGLEMRDTVSGQDVAEAYLGMLARETLDVFRMSTWAGAELEAMIEVDGVELLEQARARGQGVILLLAHYGRLLLLMLALAHRGHPMGMVTMRIDRDNPDLDLALRKYFERKIQSVLTHIGGPWLMVGDSMRPLYDGLRRGGVWVVLMDAYIPGTPNMGEFPFLGGTLCIPRGVQRIAERCGARLVYGVTREDRKPIRAELRDLGADPAQALARAVAELEHDVRAAPSQWWQWNILEYIWRSKQLPVGGPEMHR